MRDIHTSAIRPFAGNTDIFRDLSGDEYAVLRDSIAEHGIITPLVVTQDNVLIAGHQRLRVAQELGLDTVPCVVRQVVDDTELELLLIEDNVRRRHLSPYEFAKAVKRAYELNGIRAGNQVNKNDCAGVAQLAESYGVSERTIKTARTLAELIPSFGELLDAKRITKEVATHLAQLPHDAQVALYDDWDAGWKHAHADALKKLKDEYKDTMKSLTKKQKEAEECAKRYEAELADAKRALEDAEESEPDDGDEVRAQIEAEYEAQIEKLNDELAELQTKLRNVLKDKPPTPTVKAKSLGPAAGEWHTEPAPRNGALILAVWDGEEDNEYEAVRWEDESECWSTGGDSEPIAWAPIYKPRED